MCDLVPVPQSMHFPYGIERCGGLPIYLRCFASDIRVVSDTLKCFNMLGLYMSKDSGVNPTFPHVATKSNSSASVPLRGVANLNSPTARLEVSDTGREVWAYDLPYIPLNIPQFADFSRTLSLFELIKRHHIDTFDSDAQYQTSTLQVETFDATDVLAHRGFLFKAGMSNPGEIYVSNLAKPYVIGASSVYASNAIVGTVTGSRILKDVSDPTNTASYLSMGANSYTGIPLLPGESMFFEINRASEVYLNPTAAGCKLHWMPI